MLMYNYVARNPVTGQKVKAQVQADNDRAAAKLIQEQGLAPLSITLQKKVGNNIFDKVRTKDRVLFARQLSTLVSAGLPLVQSLRIVQKQSTSKSMQMILNEVINDIEAGKGFGVSLEKHPQVFSKVFTSLVSAGEASGTLDTTLERLANQQEKDAEIGSKIRGAFVYPIIVIIVMLAVVGFMIVTVLPQVKTLYDGIQGGATLPFITRVLLVVADVVTNFWWVFAILIALTVAFGSKWARTLGGKRVIDKMKMRAPIISNLYMKMYMARFSHTGSTLVASGVPLIQMLEITAASIDNIYIEESIEIAIKKVKGGKSLSEALENDPNFLELVPNMLRIGEQSGSLDEMLAKTADYYEKEVDNQIKTISIIIEPILMICLGIAALIIVAAVLLPIYSLAGKSVI